MAGRLGLLAWVIFILSASAIVNNNSVLLQAAALSNDIGANYHIHDSTGASGNFSKVFEILVKCGIRNLRVFSDEINAPYLDYYGASTGIALTVSISNSDVQRFAASFEDLTKWHQDVLYSLHITFDVKYITVGNEAIPGPSTDDVLTVMKSLQLLNNYSSFGDIKVTTSVGSSVLGDWYLPSSGEFKPNASRAMTDILGFLSASQAPLMINVYPYYAYAADPANVPLDYALLNATYPMVHDGSLEYSNLFDAMVDSFYSAMEKVDYSDVSIVVSESGWPRDGNYNFTTPELAATYNRNFLLRISSKVGTPKRPDASVKGYIYELFDGKSPHFGLFDKTFEPIYPLFQCSF
ncbi:putative glucan endo-1,3-beta-D-glucosidase [Rosa chinensis]|uniref:glucan endo-1,3-beta-D-glucosidase n=1 Tax=Rosa chinensis TaxID=74649 RepID=A0A2P6RZU2_ROSCH|nr:probable glucan endo-1,3-beta-glucosidase BG4 [Rosa chinensis]PRQ51952.1 putative glucan endo-1,3-beta-D-glucosidase [Rosa chinensis]